MVSGSFDRLRGTPGGIEAQPLQSFRVQCPNAPIIQGQINTIRVSEITMPYATPTVIGGLLADPATNNFISIQGVSLTYGAGGTTMTYASSLKVVTLPTGFYTGTEIAAAINTAISAANYPFNVGNVLTCTHSAVNNRITFTNTSTWDPTDGVDNLIFSINCFIPNSAAFSLQQPNLWWNLGFRSLAAANPPALVQNAAACAAPYTLNLYDFHATPLNYPNVGGTTVPEIPVFAPGTFSPYLIGSPYSGRYTDYIDIVSPSLCAAQYVRDGNTNQNIVKKDIIARMYIADEVSLAGNFETGSRPFLIHRQFVNPKFLRWTVERSVDVIQLELYDMFGNPLPTAPLFAWNGNAASKPLVGESSDYAITFLANEFVAKKESNVGYTY